METHPSFWTHLILGDGHAAHAYDHVVASAIVFIFCVLIAFAIRMRARLIPGHFQQLIEVIVKALVDMMEENIGKGSKKYLPLVGTLTFFIFLCNFLGMTPTFSAATGNLNTTVACALVVFFYYNFEGVRENGVGYLKHFAGPVPFMAPIMFPIEVISHLARPFSLSVRLFGNISGEHIVTIVFYTQLFAWLLPVPIMFIGLFAAFLQTFVFIMLTQVYIAGAIAHDH